jgi:hypothetical protein
MKLQELDNSRESNTR